MTVDRNGRSHRAAGTPGGGQYERGGGRAGADLPMPEKTTPMGAWAQVPPEERTPVERHEQAMWALADRHDLSGADLRGANLAWADLTDADLSGAKVRAGSGADLHDFDLRACRLQAPQLHGIRIDYEQIRGHGSGHQRILTRPAQPADRGHGPMTTDRNGRRHRAAGLPGGGRFESDHLQRPLRRAHISPLPADARIGGRKYMDDSEPRRRRIGGRRS